MSGRNLLLDSNIIIYIAQQKLMPDDFILPDDLLFVSDITWMETLGYTFSDSTEQQETEALLNVLVRLPIADAVVMKVIEIRHSRRMKLPDAIIAATALLNNCTVVTRNVSDFSGLDWLVVMNPFEK
ncbi:MAG: type II toxin-antitoxin system VapC family toxin [Saprospiraceae bacterium]|nr:type II toxin-antitoxin system VapC family toxin [Saprospiraceae bacterium]